MKKKNIHILILSILTVWTTTVSRAQNQVQSIVQESDLKGKWALVVHGGAGNMDRNSMPAEKIETIRSKITAALQLGGKALEDGGSALDAVELVVRYLEDEPEFNAGRGAVLNAEGHPEMDASVMDGKTGKAGAIAGVQRIKNPVTAARRVMEQTPHVMLIGEGAERFAREQGLELADSVWFVTPGRKADWERWKMKNRNSNLKNPDQKEGKGTVGAVALDRNGNLAAATSTGGMTGKMPGRIGDSPVIGAGTWADNKTCAISATGHGEFFIRNVVAYDIAARMEYQRLSLSESAHRVIMEKLVQQGGTGGVIGVDHLGNVTMTFNTTGMIRGSVSSHDSLQVEIFK